MPKTAPIRVTSGLVLKAAIIHDDIAFAACADAILRRVGGRDDLQVQWVITCWPVGPLTRPVLAQKALRESLDADLVVLPACHGQSVPGWLLDWLKNWAQQRQNLDAALAFMGEGDTVDLPQPVCVQLAILARDHGLNLIAHDSQAAADSTTHFGRFSREREIWPHTGRAGYARLTKPLTYRGMGTNE